MNSKKKTLPFLKPHEIEINLQKFQIFDSGSSPSSIQLNFERKFQTSFAGFGGAFTEASAHLLNQMSQIKELKF